MFINRTEPREATPTKKVLNRASSEHTNPEGAVDPLVHEDAVELSSAVKDSLQDEHQQQNPFTKKRRHNSDEPDADSESAPNIRVIDIKV